MTCLEEVMLLMLLPASKLLAVMTARCTVLSSCSRCRLHA